VGHHHAVASQVPRIGKQLSVALIILAAAWIAFGVVMGCYIEPSP